MFKKAERKQGKLRLAITGPAGSGKTHSSLLIASGIAESIFMIDTENDTACLEDGKPGIPEFLVANISEPFTPQKYIETIREAEKAGADIIIIDSLTHAWSGPGGLLDIKEVLEKRMKNSWAAWREITPEQNKLIDAIIRSKCHIIATLRTKTAWEVSKDDSGKNKPQKIGLKPEQRDGIDYEFTIVFDMDQSTHTAIASKDRTSLFSSTPFVPGKDTGILMKNWLNTGRNSNEIIEEQFEIFRDQIGGCDSIEKLDLIKKDLGNFLKLNSIPKEKQDILFQVGKEKREELNE